MRAAWFGLVSAAVGVTLGLCAVWAEVGPAGTAALPEPPAGPQPLAVVDREEFDFGQAAAGSKGEHIFRIENRGDAPLKLMKVNTSCGCTAALLSHEEVSPGQTASLTVTWETEKQGGEFRQQATIETNDRRYPRLLLTIAGKVLAPYTLSPAAFVFSGVAAGQPRTATATLWAAGQSDLRVLGHEFVDPGTAPFFDFQAEPLPAAEFPEGASSAVRLSVTLKPGLPYGPIRQTIRLRTNLAETEPIETPIEGDVKGSLLISAAPRVWNPQTQTLTLASAGPAPAGAEARARLLVFGPGHEQLTVRVAQAEPASLQVELGEPERLANQTIVPIRVAVLEDALASRGGEKEFPLGKVQLQTGRAGEPDFTIHVRFAR